MKMLEDMGIKDITTQYMINHKLVHSSMIVVEYSVSVNSHALQYHKIL